MGERMAVIRTADLGADKQAEYLDIPKEVNPIMGNRGIRLCLDRKRMFKAQLRAIYRGQRLRKPRADVPHDQLGKELDEIEELIEEVKEGLRAKDIPFKRHSHRDHDRDARCGDDRGRACEESGFFKPLEPTTWRSIPWP